MSRSSSFRYAILGVAASVICGFLHSLPFLSGFPTQRSLAAAIRGLASLRRIEGFGNASVSDLVAGRLWEAGGASLLATGQWMAVFAGWALATLFSLAVIYVIVRLLDDRRSRAILFGSAIILVLATCVPPVWMSWRNRGETASDLRLLLPSELADEVRPLSGEKVFANPTALRHLLLLLPAQEGGGVSPEDSARFALNPSQWREAFRRQRWPAVVLSGPIGEYRPLLDHLLVSPDWHLASVTNHGFLFRFGPGLPPRALEETFQFGSDHGTALYLAQIAGYYEAIRRTGDARACLERALRLAPENTSVLSHAANFAVAQRRWQDALAHSRKALESNPSLGHAKLVQALALFETGETEQAEKLTEEVLLESPNDSYTLFLSARIRRTLTDYSGEAASLEKLVTNAKNAGTSTVDYQIYLAQAYAKQGLAESALRSYRAALESDQLGPRERDDIRDAIEAIESKRAR
jgi:tetratricopeptide (TPR) repeat protein